MKNIQPYFVAALALCLLWYTVRLDYQENLWALGLALGINILYLIADGRHAAGKIRAMFRGAFYPIRGLVFCIVTTLPVILELYRKLQYPHIREQLILVMIIAVLLVFNFGFKGPAEDT